MPGVMGPTRDLGACQILFKGVDLGRTMGGVRFRFTETDAPVREDQMGSDPVDDINVGSTCSVEVPLTRMQTAKIAALLAGASGDDTSGETMTVKQSVGVSRYARAGELVLKPLNGTAADPDTDKWLHVFKASPQADIELVYDATTQRVYKMTFKGYPDQTSGMNSRIWRIGPVLA